MLEDCEDDKNGQGVRVVLPHGWYALAVANDASMATKVKMPSTDPTAFGWEKVLPLVTTAE